MTNGTMDDEAMPNGTLQMLRQLLQGAAPADATFTTAKGEGGIAKARREALAKLHPPTLADKLSSALSGLGITVQGPNSNIRESAPLIDSWNLNTGKMRMENFGNNGNVLGGRVSDSTALQNMQMPLWYNVTGTPQEIAASTAGSNRNKFKDYYEIPDVYTAQDRVLAEQIARLKTLRARNSNNPG